MRSGISYWPAVLWNVFVAVISLLPGKDIPQISWADAISLDKWVHAFVYAVLFLSIALYRQGQRDGYKTGSLVLIFLYTVFFGILMEVLQEAFYADRYFDILDIIANIIGSIAGLGIFILWHKKIALWILHYLAQR